jgi:hypothetical protein
MSDAVVQGPGFATATTRDQTHALLGQAMGLVAATAGFTALGACVGRNMTGAGTLLPFIAARRGCVARRPAGDDPRGGSGTGSPSMTEGAQAQLNALPHFTTGIDRVDVHFIHVKSHVSELRAAFRSLR